VWWIHTYWWLENNNLWKACVAWGVGLTLNATWAVRIWLKQQKHNRNVLDKLDTETPGGLGEIKRMINGERDPDDNGTDPNDDDRRQVHAPEHNVGHTSLLDNIHVPKGGGSGAGHR
jgi:hypothetical protein